MDYTWYLTAENVKKNMYNKPCLIKHLPNAWMYFVSTLIINPIWVIGFIFCTVLIDTVDSATKFLFHCMDRHDSISLNVVLCLPLVFTVATERFVRASQIRIVLSPLAVTNWSGFFGCQHSWSTLSLWPRRVQSFTLVMTRKISL